MIRPVLTLARAKPARGPSRLALVKKAIRLFRGRGVPKATYRRNAMKWVAARTAMGDRHILKGAQVSWGQPGEPSVQQVHAPRHHRNGGRA